MTKIHNIFKSKPTFDDFRIKSKATFDDFRIKSKATGKEKDFQYTSNHPFHPIVWSNNSCLLNVIRSKE